MDNKSDKVHKLHQILQSPENRQPKYYSIIVLHQILQGPENGQIKYQASKLAPNLMGYSLSFILAISK